MDFFLSNLVPLWDSHIGIMRKSKKVNIKSIYINPKEMLWISMVINRCGQRYMLEGPSRPKKQQEQWLLSFTIHPIIPQGDIVWNWYLIIFEAGKTGFTWLTNSFTAAWPQDCNYNRRSYKFQCRVGAAGALGVSLGTQGPRPYYY